MLPRTGPAMALLPLRVFLGVTFVYAGVQKLSDPGFLHKGAPTYIGSQLQAFAHGTPGGFLLRTFAIPHPALSGVGVAFLEIAVGLLVLAGLFTQVAAAVGLGLNLILFLTNSWNTSPYFLGSDIVFVFAWLPFVLTGASGQPALDHELERRTARPRARAATVAAAGGLSRRDAVLRGLGATGALTLGIGGVAAAMKGTYKGASTVALKPRAPAKRRSSSHPSRQPAAGSRQVPANAVRLGPSSRLPSGQGATYSDPSDGQPDIVVRLPSGKLVAHSAVCTHAGCTVGYQGGEIVCPCHGGVYNAETGAVEGGPPPQGLAPKKVIERGGAIYAVPS
jgi:thiosulfate dehydrogenase [quinone] large subunit